MKLVGVREAQEHLSELLHAAQKENVVVTRHGRPVAVLWGVEGKDIEEILLERDPRFADLIASRRRGSPRLVPYEDVVARTDRGTRIEEGRAGYRGKRRGGASRKHRAK